MIIYYPTTPTSIIKTTILLLITASTCDISKAFSLPLLEIHYRHRIKSRVCINQVSSSSSSSLVSKISVDRNNYYDRNRIQRVCRWKSGDDHLLGVFGRNQCSSSFPLLAARYDSSLNTSTDQRQTEGTNTARTSSLLLLNDDLSGNTSNRNVEHNTDVEKIKIILSRSTEIANIFTSIAVPLLTSAITTIQQRKDITTSDETIDIWDKFWSSTSTASSNNISSSSSSSAKHHTTTKLTNAKLLVSALESLGPTYVKFGQALSSRPDIIPPSLADALTTLQDNMKPFDTDVAKDIIRKELLEISSSSLLTSKNTPTDENAIHIMSNEERITKLIDSLSSEPVAAASVGQVYKGFLKDYGDVAVKVQRPGIREIVQRDEVLLRSIASFLESIPSFGINTSSSSSSFTTTTASTTNGSTSTTRRLIQTELVAAVDEFMSRIFEELDYTNEASNAKLFAQLYSTQNGSLRHALPNGKGVIVPDIVLDLCTKNVIIMSWIEGEKLTSFLENDNVVLQHNHDSNSRIIMRKLKNKKDPSAISNETVRNENLRLIEQALYVTLSQLLDTGVMHADPHGGNLLKVRDSTNQSSTQNSSSSSLAYLDFGLLATIPSSVRDGLVCAVVQLIFAKDVEAVATLFGELDLLPKQILEDESERAALSVALTKLMENILKYPSGESLYTTPSSSSSFGSTSRSNSNTNIPNLNFDKLLDGLTRLIPRFKFRLPPYFINNARALGTLEGIARSLDPNFNCLQFMYPYALYRLLQNPSGSAVVDQTLQSLIRSKETGRIDGKKVARLLRDSALFTGFSRRKVLLDIVKTKGGRNIIYRASLENMKYKLSRLIVNPLLLVRNTESSKMKMKRRTRVGFSKFLEF